MQQSVLVEGTRLCAKGLVVQTGVSASSVAPPAAPCFAPAAASSAEQPASTTAAPRSVKRPVEAASGKRSLDSASAGQPGRDSKVPRAGASSSSASSSAAAAPSLKAAPPPHSDAQASAAQPGAPTKRQRGIDSYAKAAQPGSASACSSSAAPPAAPSASEPLQRSLFDYGAIPDDLADLRRAMGQMRTELSRLTKQTAADDSAMETLTALLRQATQLHQIPATLRTLEFPDIRILYAIDCGKLQLRRQPYQGV